MLKMLLDPMGGIVLTNDGNAILREVFFIKLKNYRSMWHTQLPRA
jgi:chaperonin GroEL (HSP60 family)